jgi:thiamine pyrophosphokinase
MSNNFLIVTCEDHVNYQYFAKFKKVGVERGCIDIINHNEVLDYAISDFDNVLDEEIDVIKDKAISFQQLSCDKDFLDGEEAIKIGTRTRCRQNCFGGKTNKTLWYEF